MEGNYEVKNVYKIKKALRKKVIWKLIKNFWLRKMRKNNPISGWHINSDSIIVLITEELRDYLWIIWRRKWQPTPVFLPGESQGWRSLAGCTLWGPTESDMTEATWRQQQQLWIISKANFSSWYQLTPGSSSDK